MAQRLGHPLDALYDAHDNMRCPSAFDDPEFWAAIGPVVKQTNRKRGKVGVERWRQAQGRMMDLHKNAKLPPTLRQTQKLLQADGFTPSTVRIAALKSSILVSRFRLKGSLTKPECSLLDELAEQADHRTRRAIARLSTRGRRDAERALCEMDPARRAALLRTLATNPDSGRVPGVQHIENADCRRPIAQGDCNRVSAT
ncbi:MAG: hypothetical protein KJ749_00655 [Planctomycetes bacterium]|nr:hypothetical protein [Planctomycetota bacterium]